jgi:Ca-activated chloride channel homolog
MKPVRIKEKRVCGIALIAALIGLVCGLWMNAAQVGATVNASSVICSIEVDKSALPVNGPRKVIAKVTLRADKPVASSDRRPVNLSIALDRSGSMTGDKINKAKEAAIEAVKRLGPKDVFSLVVYDHTIQTLIPAQRVKDLDDISSKIRTISPGGSTALFGGVTQAAAEIRKHIEDKYTHRIILLSDGLANVGPSTPEELGRLGAALVKEGISVTTVGVGTDYNEDLMTRLSRKSDGNAYFAESSSDLSKIFATELGDVLSVVATKVSIVIECPDGVRPISFIGREGRVHGQKAEIFLNQLYGGQEKYALLELDVEGKSHNEDIEAAVAKVSFNDRLQAEPQTVVGKAAIRFSRDQAEVDQSANPAVITAYEMTLNALTQDRAVVLADKGNTREAIEELYKSAERLKSTGLKYSDQNLLKKADQQIQGTKEIEAQGWGQKSRKELRTDSYQNINQQQQYTGPNKSKMQLSPR